MLIANPNLAQLNGEMLKSKPAKFQEMGDMRQER